MKRITFIIVFFILLGFKQEQKPNNKNVLTKKWELICEESNNELFCKVLSFYNENQFDSCYVYASKALLNKNLKTKEKDFFHFVLGYTAYDKELFTKALHNFSLMSNDKDYELKLLFTRGNILFNQEKYDEAILKYQEYLVKSDSKKVYENIGICYLMKKQYKIAEEYLEKSVDMVDKKDTTALINSKTNLANIYYNQYLDDKAIPLFKEAYDLAKTQKKIDLKKLTSQNMAVVEKNRKRYKESITYYEEFFRWKDSIWNKEKIWELIEKDKALSIAHKQQEITVQEEEIKRQKIVRNGLIIGASSLLLFILCLGYFYKKLQDKNRLITKQKKQLDVANKTKNYLFSVVSHDLRSPVNTIKRQCLKLLQFIEKKDLSAIKETTEKAIVVTDNTSHLLDNVLQWSLDQSNQLNFSYEEYALQPIIEHILYGYKDLIESNEIGITANFEEGIVAKTDKESLKIVIRNLVDNSVKYMNGSGKIVITTSQYSKDKAKIEIKDSGIGISPEKLEQINSLKDLSVDKIDRSKGVGLGLILCQTLIKKNNGTLFFESEEGKSTTAVILLPLV